MKRTMQILVALVGMLLISFAVAVPAQAADPDAPADIVMVSSASLELPADIVLASPKSNMEAGCAKGVSDSNNNGRVIPETIEETGCSMYFVNRSGPDSNGLYYYQWRLPIAPAGGLVVESYAWSNNSANADKKGFPITVTRNQIRYGDFRTCIDTRTDKALIAWYAPMTTEVVFRLEEKVQQGAHWAWKARKPKRFEFEISPFTSYAPYSRRFARFRVPVDLLPPKEAHYTRGFDLKRYNKRLVRGMYLIKKGGLVIKKGYVAARKPCQELPFSPYVQP